MLHPRLIPVLLIHNKGLVKTVKFKDPKYVGDPLNAVRIFNEKQVDELIVLNIDASSQNHEPDYKTIENLAAECRMPFCYGGGIKTAQQAKQILSLGVEKISLSTAAIQTPNLVTEIAEQVGNQSVVVTLDVKKKLFSSKYEVFTHNGKNNTKLCPIELSQHFQALGAGEIVINSIDNDGVMKGYDLELIRKVHSNLSIPLTVAGGAGRANIKPSSSAIPANAKSRH
jgi:imidazole glycerol-phosphate synthase subunit HisF